MDLLGVGPLELVFILLIIFLILGPDDLVATGKKLGKFLNATQKSEFWQGVTQVTKQVRTLPNTLMREAQLEETKKELEKDISDVQAVAKEFELKEVKALEKDLNEELQVDLDEPKIAPPSLSSAAESNEPEAQPETPTESESLTETEEEKE